MTSSQDARQDWQGSVLRDLVPADAGTNDHAPEPAADESDATQVVNPAVLGAMVPRQPAAMPTPTEDGEPAPVEGTEPPLDVAGYPPPPPEPAPYPQQDYPSYPAAAQYPGTQYPGNQYPGNQYPAAQYPAPEAPGQPMRYPPDPGSAYPPQQAPPYPAAQGYPGPYTHPRPGALPAPPAPVGQPVPPGHPGQPPAPGMSRVFGPDATPVPEQWTPDGLLTMPAHADNWHQRFRTSVRGIGGSANASRVAAELSRELSQPVTTGRRIAVLGIRGGSGKSTVASLLVSAYATHRGDRVLAIDADPDLGSLGLRLGSNSPTSLASLGKVPRVWQTLDDAERCLGRTQSGAWLLAGERGVAAPETVTPNAYLGVLHGISRYFAVTVVDAGAGMVTQLNQSVLADAHAIVLATPASIDGVISVRRALEWIREWGPHRLPQTIIALTAMSPQATDLNLDRTAEAVTPFGVTPALLPYDRHLATGSTIEPWRLGERTRNAAVQLAAAVLRRARTG